MEEMIDEGSCDSLLYNREGQIFRIADEILLVVDSSMLLSSISRFHVAYAIEDQAVLRAVHESKLLLYEKRGHRIA
jgi:hypothetical protein